MKRVLAFVLAFTMMFGNTSVAFAETPEDSANMEVISEELSEVFEENVIYDGEENVEVSFEENNTEEDKTVQEDITEEEIVQESIETETNTFFQSGEQQKIEISNVFIEQDFEYITLKWECDSEQETEAKLYGFRVYMSSDIDGSYIQVGDEEESGQEYYSHLMGDIELDSTTGKNVTKYFKIVPVYHLLDDEGYITNTYVEGEACGIYSNEGAYYAENTQSASTILDPNPYIGLCFLEQDKNGEYKEINEVKLHIGESKKIIIGLIDKDGNVTPVPSEEDYAKLLNANSVYVPSAKWGVWAYGDAEASENSSFVQREFTVEMSDGFSAYYTGAAVTGDGNYFLQYRRNLGIGWYYERIPLKVLEAEEGVEYEKAPILQVAATPKEFNAIVREKMKNRDYTPFASLVETQDLYDVFDFYQERDGMEPDEGDYLHYAVGDPNSSSVFYQHYIDAGSMNYNGERYDLYIIGTPFITSRAQEDEVDAKIEELFAADGALYGLEDKTDKEKVEAIFNYVKKVKSATGDRRQPILHTAYHALIKGSGTCEAYALLFTRLTRELGIASKVIMGTDANAHTYNIVEINGKWYYIDCSANIGLSTAKTFKRTTEQDQYKDQRFINNYLCKVVDSNETYIAEPGVIITNNMDEASVMYERNAEISDVLAAAQEYILTDAAQPGNESKEYKIALTANVFVDYPDRDTLDFGEYADRVEIDLDKHSLIIEDYMGMSVRASKVSNGTIVLGNYAKIYAEYLNNKKDSVYTDLNFIYKQSETNIDYGQYKMASVWLGNESASDDEDWGLIKIENDVVFEGALYIGLGDNVHSKADMDALWVSLNDNSVSEGTIITEDCNIYGNAKVNNLKIKNYTEITYNVESIRVYGELEFGKSTVLNGENTVTIYPVKEYASADSEAAEREGKVSFQGEFSAGNRGTENPYFKLSPSKQIAGGEFVEQVYTVGEKIAVLKNVSVKSLSDGTVTKVTQNNLSNFVCCPLNPDIENLSLELDGENLMAAFPLVEVFCEDQSLGKFSSLKKAINEIDKNPLTGSYTFVFAGDSSLSADITLPSYMQNTVFTTPADEEGTVSSTVCLDLLGHKLNVAGKLTVESGVNILDSAGGAAIAAAKTMVELKGRKGYEGISKIEPNIQAKDLLVSMDKETEVNHIWNLGELTVSGTFRNGKNSVLKAESLLMNTGIFINENNACAEIKQVKKVVKTEFLKDSCLIADWYTQASTGISSLWTGAKITINESGTIYKPTLLKSENGNSDLETIHIYQLPETNLQILGTITNKEKVKISFGLLKEKGALEQSVLKDYDEQVKLFDTTFAAGKLDLSQFVVEQASADSFSEYKAVFHSDKSVYVGKEWFTLKQTDGENENTLAGFAKWSDVVAYINKLKNKNAAYVIEISETIDLNEVLTMPTTLSSLNVRGQDDNAVSITYVGDVKLTVPTTFENLEFAAKRYNSKTKVYDSYVSVLNLNNKKVTFKNCEGTFASVTTGTKSVVTFVDAKINVTKSVTVKDLVMENTQFSTDSLTVSNLLTMKSAEIFCKNKITLKDVKTEDSANILGYAENTTKKNTLMIKGTIFSSNPGTTEVSKGETVITVRENAVTLRMKKSDGTEVVCSQDTFLCKAPKAGAGWFKVGSGADISGTYKKGDFIYCGNVVENVKLYSAATEDAEYSWESSFVTLNEAFAEINKLGIATQHYKVVLTDSTENIVSSKKKALTAPTKAANVMITASGNEPMPIYFKGNLTLKTNMVLKNIVLEPAAKYSISIGNFALTLDNFSRSAIPLSSISGSGTAKKSAIYLIDTELYVNGGVNNVGKIGFDSTAGKDSSLTAEGKITIGDVLLYKDGYLTGLVSVTRKKGAVTKLASKITIQGQVYNKDESKDHVLYLDYLEYSSKQYKKFDLKNDEVKNVIDAGFDAAKALKVNYEHIQLNQLKGRNLIKSKGNLLYFSGSPAVMLCYMHDGKEIIVSCKGFADAVTDINNLKVKREYQIVLLENIGIDAPITLTMPSYAQKVLVKSYEGSVPATVYMKGNITLKTDTEFCNLRFAPLYKSKGTTMNIFSGKFNLMLKDIMMLDAKTMSVKDITGGGKQTIILDSNDLIISGKINKADRIIVRKTAAVNGTVITNYLQYDAQDVELILNGKSNTIKHPIITNY